jgi:ABC-2 type transport system permease protein
LLPGVLMMQQPSMRRVAVVTPDARLGKAVCSELTDGQLPAKELGLEGKESARSRRTEFSAEPQGPPSESLREKLMDDLRKGRVDGVVWIDKDAATTRQATYYSRSAGDLVASALVARAVRLALAQRQLAADGFPAKEAKALLSPVSIDSVRIDRQGANRSNGVGAFLMPFVLLFAIYMSVLVYGIYVMRSVIEEKNSRVVEVLLGSVSPMQLMAGKIIGVGAVGLTQIAVWAALAVLLDSGGQAVLRHSLGAAVRDAHLGWPVLVLFPVYFLLGYATYASLYAAIGAMVTSDEEASQYQLPVTLPLLLCMVLATVVIGDPNSQVAIWLSMFPLTSPIIMFVRVSVSMPPLWQVLLSLAISVGALYGLVWLSARIYRVGILMYGKRPNLAELRKWVRQA